METQTEVEEEVVEEEVVVAKKKKKVKVLDVGSIPLEFGLKSVQRLYQARTC